MKKYEKYITTWHYFLKDWEQIVVSLANPEEVKQYVMYLLMQFYNKPYDLTTDFYPQFYQRLSEAKELVGME